MLIFVYGTLKRGHGNYDRLLRESRFVGVGKTVRLFTMTCVGFPFAFLGGDGAAPVRGEVFEIDRDTLVKLDRLESEGHMYDRTQQLIEMDDGDVKLCMMYVAKSHNRRQGSSVGAVLPSADGTLTWRLRS